MRALRLSKSVVLAVVALSMVACGGGGGGGGAPAASTSTTTPGTTTPGGTVTPGMTPPPMPMGPLAQKAHDFDILAQSQHSPNGLIYNVRLDSGGNLQEITEILSTTLWTSSYIGSQAYRYRVTNDPVALANMERALWALHGCHEITNAPAFFARSYGDAAWYPQTNKLAVGTGPHAGDVWHADSSSRDQYTGIFFAFATAWPHIQDQALRDAIRVDCLTIAYHLMQHDLALETLVNGTLEQHFKVDPSDAYLDNITPQNWAQVDDFPFNLIVQSVPYDQELVDALKTVKIPPVRGGEALRAMMFFAVASEITQDPAIEDYYRNVLIAQRDFDDIAVNYGSFIDDLFHGNNAPLVEQALTELFASLSSAITTYFGNKWGSPALAQAVQPLLANLLGQAGNFVGQRINDVIAWLRQPNNLQNVNDVAQALQMIATILDMVGIKDVAQTIQGIATPAATYSQHGLDEAADAMRSYVGENITYLAYAGILEVETDPALRQKLIGALDRRWQYINDEQNALFNTIHSGYTGQSVPSDVQDSHSALTLFPTDLSQRFVDHTNDPNIVKSPYPDRFGKTGELALDPLPIDQRPFDHFNWRSHPAKLKGGANDPNNKLAPTGYLLPYWMGRYFNFYTDQD